MKCLECKYSEIIEQGCKGYIGETIVKCNICNEINGEMENCKDFEDKEELDEYLREVE